MKKVYSAVKKTATFVMFVCIAISCRREEEVFPEMHTIDAEKLWLDQITHVLLGVYRDSLSLAEVNAAIATEYYQDERVLMKDLLYPETSELYKTERFKQLFPHQPRFAQQFRSVLNSGNYPFSERYANHKAETNFKARTSNEAPITPRPLEIDWIVKNGVNVYFPYSENFAGTTKKITTVRPPTDYSIPTNTGYRAVYTQICPTPNRSDCYRGWESQPFTVGDEYAWVWPTHVIDILKEIIRINTIYNDPNLPGNRLVKAGWVKAEKYLDFFWNGGPDIQFIRAEAYLDPNNRAAGRLGEVGKSIKRKDVRQQNWVRFDVVWDPNWTSESASQSLIVYEADNNVATTKLSVSPKVKFGTTELSLFNYEVSITTREPTIFVNTFRYVDFWSFNKLDTGHGTRDTFQVFQGREGVQFTLPVQIY